MDLAQAIVAAKIWNTMLTFTLFFSGIFLAAVARRAYKAGNTYGAVSTALSSIFILFFSFVNNVWGLFPGIQGALEDQPGGLEGGYPLNAFFVWWIGGTLAVYLGYAAKMRLKDKKEARLHRDDQDAYWEMFRTQDKSLYQADISVKMEGVRKAFHLAGLLLVASFYGLGFIGPVTDIVNTTVLNHIYNVDPNGYVLLFGPQDLYYYFQSDPQVLRDLTFFALLGTLTFVLFPDIIRANWATRYSLYNRLTGKVLRGKEYKAAGPQVYLITGVSFSFLFYMYDFYPVEIPFAAALVACFSDALAALIGRKWGKKKVNCPGGKIKTLEGFIAGVGSAYLISLIFVGPILAIVAAVVFFLLDYFPNPVADNLSNPILISIALWVITAWGGVPIGW